MGSIQTEHTKWDPHGARMVIDNSDLHVIMLMNRDLSREQIIRQTQSPMFLLLVTANTRAAISRMIEASK